MTLKRGRKYDIEILDGKAILSNVDNGADVAYVHDDGSMLWVGQKPDYSGYVDALCDAISAIEMAIGNENLNALNALCIEYAPSSFETRRI